jgi:hypothetical protein
MTGKDGAPPRLSVKSSEVSWHPPGTALRLKGDASNRAVWSAAAWATIKAGLQAECSECSECSDP